MVDHVMTTESLGPVPADRAKWNALMGMLKV